MDTKGIFLLGCAFALLDVFLLLKRKGIWDRLGAEQRTVIFVLAVLCVLSSVQLFTDYTVRGHDTRFHLMRIEGIADGILSEQFPVKIQQEWLNGYGYPVSVMYGDILLYFPAVLRIVGFSLQDAYKAYVIFINMVTAVSAYFCMRHMTESRWTALLAGGLYALAPYRLINLYVRGAVGEYTAMAFLPVAFLGLHLVLGDKAWEKRRGFLCLAVGYTMILQSHLLTFGMAILFSAAYCLWHFKESFRNLALLAFSAVVTLALNAGFLVPFMDYMVSLEMNVESGSSLNMQGHGLFLAQLFQTFSFGGYQSNPASEGAASDMPLTIGLPIVFVFFLFLWECMVCRARLREGNGARGWKEQVCLFWLLVLGVWMSTHLFPWGQIVKLPFIGQKLSSYQFAWRFLAVATAVGALLGGYVAGNLKYAVPKAAETAIISVFCVISLFSAASLMDRTLSTAGAYRFISGASVNTLAVVNSGEYLLEGTSVQDLKEPYVRAGDGVTVAGAGWKGKKYVVSCVNDSGEASAITVPILAYKGYVAEDDALGTRFATSAGDANILTVAIPAGYAGNVEVFFREPFLWRAAEAVSLAAFFVVLSAALWLRRTEGRSTAV